MTKNISPSLGLAWCHRRKPLQTERNNKIYSWCGTVLPYVVHDKTQHRCTQGPHHVLLQLRYVRKIGPSVQALILHEPYLTCSMTEEELQAAVLNGLEFPYFPVHGQAFEWTVKLVTEAASAVAGWDKRDSYIRVRRINRNDMPRQWPILSSKFFQFCLSVRQYNPWAKNVKT